MAQAILTVEISMESPDTDLKAVEADAKKVIESNGGTWGKAEVVPIAFGLKMLKLMFIIDEKLGSDLFEEKLGQLEGIGTASVTDFRRAIG